MTTKRRGTVIFFNHAKGFGFAAQVDDAGNRSGNDVFIHLSNMPPEHKYASEGDKILFELGERNGKPLALHIEFVDSMVQS